jgi:hypothetical protein
VARIFRGVGQDYPWRVAPHGTTLRPGHTRGPAAAGSRGTACRGLRPRPRSACSSTGPYAAGTMLFFKDAGDVGRVRRRLCAAAEGRIHDDRRSSYGAQPPQLRCQGRDPLLCKGVRYTRGMTAHCTMLPCGSRAVVAIDIEDYHSLVGLQNVARRLTVAGSAFLGPAHAAAGVAAGRQFVRCCCTNAAHSVVLPALGVAGRPGICSHSRKCVALIRGFHARRQDAGVRFEQAGLLFRPGLGQGPSLATAVRRRWLFLTGRHGADRARSPLRREAGRIAGGLQAECS